MEVASTRMQGLLLIAITLLQVAFTTMQGIHATKHPHNDSKQNGRLDYKVTYCVFGNPLIEVHAPPSIIVVASLIPQMLAQVGEVV
jgi:hypothetical protein